MILFTFNRSKLQRDKERDISEQIALGLASAPPSQEAMFDQRLFNQSKVNRTQTCIEAAHMPPSFTAHPVVELIFSLSQLPFFNVTVSRSSGPGLWLWWRR